MANYMTQAMSYGQLPRITYYRKQSAPHVSHAESGAFTSDAIQHYADTHQVPPDAVEKGRYLSGQGVPTAGQTEEI
ncbi:MAG: hypothetical protein CMI02_19065 [Oceanospirillaceae bacterium]|nr:hypothetical protein [Oceanospirillaceae bacterium]MBT14129.1 hypothetical protein [Oceanospirillaceae bacterium]